MGQVVQVLARWCVGLTQNKRQKSGLRSMTMTLYGGSTTRSGRCIWMLEELNQPYHLHVVDFRGGEHRSPDYLKLNPNGKVPTLVDGDLAYLNPRPL